MGTTGRYWLLLPKGVVPWSAVYRRWSSPRGSMALRTLDTAGLEGLLVEVRETLAPLADADPQVQRDLAALEVMLADQRGRVPAAPRPDAPASAPATGTASASTATGGRAEPGTGPGRGRRDRRRDGATTTERGRNGVTEIGSVESASDSPLRMISFLPGVRASTTALRFPRMQVFFTVR